ncbi:MAG: hypothetical protein IT228_00865 [Flavobacteriales bacterium]|nr:hypothetical protein [Flavobacteriales bacterium]MCC6575872.1 hypothetical protein [Flavobacteriales bacterium]NUQ14169.1 hypothetical protein [Flavobacteriales bacterium]
MSRHAPIALLATLLLALGACTRNAHPELLAEVDVMLRRADSLKRIVDTIDLAAYDRMDSVFRGQRSALEELLKDTMAREQAVPIGNYYRAMDRSLGRVRKRTAELREGLERSKVQLADLRHDIGRDLLPEGPRTTYLQQERMELDRLEKGVTTVTRSAGTCRREWEARHRAIAELLAAPDPAP